MMETEESELDKWNVRKGLANDFFKNGHIDDAREVYLDVINEIQAKDNQSQPKDEILISCMNNLCSVYLSMEDFQGCIDFASKILDIDGTNLKAHFRRAQALGKLEKYDLAVSDLHDILKIEPTNKQAQDLLESFKQIPELALSLVVIESNNVGNEINNSSSQVQAEDPSRRIFQEAPKSNSLEQAKQDYGFMNPNWTPPQDGTDSHVPGSSQAVSTITQKLKSSILIAAQKQQERKAVFKKTLQAKKCSDDAGEDVDLGVSRRDKSLVYQQKKIEVDPDVNVALNELQQLEKQAILQIQEKVSKTTEKAKKGKQKGSIDIDRLRFGKGAIDRSKALSQSSVDAWRLLEEEEILQKDKVKKVIKEKKIKAAVSSL